MKNLSKKTLGIICAVVLVAAVAVVGLIVRNRQQAEEQAGALQLQYGEQRLTIPLKELDQAEFSGETVNGKGDVFTRTYRGVELQALLEARKIDPTAVGGVTAVAADQFSAELTGDEVREAGRVYLAVQVDGKRVEGIDPGTPGVQLVVFGDSNSKRNVRNLSVLQIAPQE